ncbi:MAG: hypothetical protein Q9M34_00530, partial [Sulfurimonas sp.]|nr:hypothetical protein [Sulfurimonas sp.]
TLSLAATVALSMTGCGGSDTTTTTTTTGGGTVTPTTALQVIVAEDGITRTLDNTTLSAQAYTSDVNLTADTVYELTGLVEIQSPATLNIEAGTTIIGNDGAYIVVEQGAQINADGNITNPIVFTSKIAYNGGVSEPGQWGGLTILGKATTNDATSPFYEVDQTKSGFVYGGTTDADNSGVLNYVSILNSGSIIGTDIEINGLSLCGVGSGTTVSNITVVNSSDDGIEVWGGTVNMSNLTIIGALDDSLDLDSGYTGTVDGVYVSQLGVAHAGFEISSGGDTPMTSATIKNFSIVKVDGSDEGGIYIKDDTTAPTFINGSVIPKGTDAALLVRNAMLPAQIAAISFDSVLLDANVTYGGTGADQMKTKLEN